MIIDCVSDLHGNFPTLDGGDLLIIAGDLTARGTEPEYFECFDWIHAQPYRKKILIAGNHDMQMQDENYSGPVGDVKESFEYLCDSGTEFEGFKIWGSPWTLWFKGINPHCTAFTVKTEEELAEKFQSIPSDVDILVTHSPPWNILDKTCRGKNVGCRYLAGALEYCFRPKLWVFGHVHEAYGVADFKEMTKLVNASLVDVNYKPVNKPIRVDLK